MLRHTFQTSVNIPKNHLHFFRNSPRKSEKQQQKYRLDTVIDKAQVFVCLEVGSGGSGGMGVLVRDAHTTLTDRKPRPSSFRKFHMR